MTAQPSRPLTAAPDVRVELITPDKAQNYLGQNTHNRHLRQSAVNAYARDMAAGVWQWNGDGIKIATDGTLLDGQHRLAAIVQSGVSLFLPVTSGLPVAAQETMDTGIHRTFADALSLRGHANATALGSVCRTVLTWERGVRHFGGGGRNRRFTSHELSGVLDRYPWIVDGMGTVNRLRRAGLPASAGGLAYWLFTPIDAGDAAHFFERLISDEHHVSGDPITELRRVLMASTPGGGARRGNLTMIIALTIKAWNRYRRGEQVKLLRFRIGGAQPEDFPEPV